MAEKIEVDLEVKSNLEPTIKNLRELKNQLKQTAAGSSEFNKISAQIRDMDDAISDAKATNDDFLGQLENASGPLGALGQSIRGAERTFSSFNGALKASVIGLIVALIGGLVKAFQDNEVAMKKLQPLLQGMEKIFQGIFRVVEPLFNILVDLALKALPYVSQAFNVVYSSVTAVFQSLGMLGGAVKKLISGDFSGAWEDAKKSVTSFSQNYDEASKRFITGTKEMTDAEREAAEKQKELLEKQKEARRKAAEELAAQRKRDLDALKAALKAQQDATQTTYNEVTQAIGDAQDKQSEFFMTATEAEIRNVQDKYFRLLELAKQQNRSKEEIDALEIARDNEVNDIKLKNKQDAGKKEIDIDKEVAAAKKAIQESSFSVLEGGIGLLKGLFEKNKDIQKGLLIAESAVGIARIITATQAANAADTFTAASLGPILGPVYLGKKLLLNNVGAGIGIAANVLATSKALSALGGGGSASGGTSPSGPTGGGAAPQFNVVGATGVNQLAGAISNREQQPVQAYVVANNVTTAQGLDRNIIRSATLG
jgi:DNA segregation ATPase FtsK/SpoIIIE-like protein